MSDAKQDMIEAAVAVRKAVDTLSAVRGTMERFLKECHDMENFGPVLAPSLFLNPQRQHMVEAVVPMFQAAILLIEAHDVALKMLEGVVIPKNE